MYLSTHTVTNSDILVVSVGFGPPYRATGHQALTDQLTYGSLTFQNVRNLLHMGHMLRSPGPSGTGTQVSPLISHICWSEWSDTRC